MKKYILLIALSIFSLNAIHAEITWTLSDDGTLTISGTDMPNYKYGGAPWYSQRNKIKKVVIENGVTSIGNYAFDGCSGLTSVTIPNSVTSIGESAFFVCSGLTSVTIPNSVTSIGMSTFQYCFSLTSINIPNSVTNISACAFSGCRGLTSITIPNSVTSIEDAAFESCTGLTSINIPNSVTSIGEDAFCNCSGLISVTIPNSVTSIGSRAFSGCTGLTSITIPNSVTSIGYSAFSRCSGLISVTIPESVTSIGDGNFSGCSGLTSVTIPNSVTYIGERAFNGCTSLTSVTIPNSVTSIGEDAFNGCYLLADKFVNKSNCYCEYKVVDIEQNDGLLLIGNEVVNCRKWATSVTIPNSVTSIGEYAFWGCKSLTSVTIPNSVTSIGEDAFNGCSGLISVTIPNSVTSIGIRAFYDCSGLTSIIIPNSVTSIGGGAFSGCSGLTSVPIPNSVTSIGSSAFYGCSGLTSVTIPESVTSVGDGTFSNCSGLTSITCEASTPPNCSYNYNPIFYNVNKSIPVYVPANSVDAYKKANVWKDFTNIQEIPDNKKIADAVVALINAIGKVEYTDACKDQIDKANNAYNALTDEQKTLVTNLEVLTNAQQTYETLKAAAEKLIADKAAFNKYKSEIIAIIEALVKDDDSDAVKEIIRKAISNIEALEYDVAITLDNNKAKVQSFVTSTDEAVENQRAEDQKINGIEELEFAEKYNIYDLNGRKITNSMLKSGLYIRNGKKVVVK